MAAERLILLKSWKHPYRKKPYAVGTILQFLDTSVASDLIRDKIAEKYEGNYPPKNKVHTNFFQPKTK